MHTDETKSSSNLNRDCPTDAPELGDEGAGASPLPAPTVVRATRTVVASLYSDDMATSTAPVGDLYNYRQVFVENFDVDVPLGSFPKAVSTKWAAYGDGTPDSTDHGHYYPTRTVSVKDGTCNIHVHTEDGIHMTAALLPKFASTYGRYALRWRTDSMHNYKMVSILLWPNRSQTGPNKLGEIDCGEMNCDSSRIGHFLHRRWINDVKPPQGYVFIDGNPSDWHVSVVEWSPGLVVYYLDDKEVYRDDVGIPNEGFHWVIQVETALSGAPPPADDVAGVVQIDWVTGYKYDTAARPPQTTKQLVLAAPATAVNTVTLAIDASDDVNAVKFMLDASTEIGYDSARPFSRSWDSTRFANGTHSIWAKGHTTTWFNSPKSTIRIHNPWDIVMPNETFTGKVPLGLDQAYPWIRQVQWAVDGHNVGNRSATPWTFNWDSSTVPNGPHTIYVKTYGTLSETGSPMWLNGPSHTILVEN